MFRPAEPLIFSVPVLPAKLAISNWVPPAVFCTFSVPPLKL